MCFVLVFPLILAFFFTGQSHTEVTEPKTNFCYEMCPAGYHKVGECDDPVATNRCEKCGENKFTDIPNFVTECQRCDTCKENEVEVKPCTFNSNVECDCKKGYFYAGFSFERRYCRSCNCNHCKGLNRHDYKKKCLLCERKECLEIPECKKKCAPIAVLSANLSTAATTSAPTSTRTTASNNTSNPIVNPGPNNSAKETPWLILVMSLVTLLVFFLLLLLFARNTIRYLNSCFCWSTNKDLVPPVQDAKFNEQSSHQGSSPNMLTFNISEETPMMTLSQIPATPQHPAHISPLPPDAEAARQDEQPEHWPAIVLYAIIKEVPLRRWKEFLRLLSVADQQLERVELEASFGLGSMERQYQMLRLWSQRSSASLNDVFSALHHMDLSGCAQLLQESLEKLQWRPELKQGFTACRSYTDHGLNGAMQDT